MPPHLRPSAASDVYKRQHAPNAVSCPGDETERSQLLGTSYRWAAAYNGIKYKDLRRAVDKPLLTDRDTFHTGSDFASNELLLKRTQNSYQFVVTSGTSAEFEEPGPIADSESELEVPRPNKRPHHTKRTKAGKCDQIRRGKHREYR